MLIGEHTIDNGQHRVVYETGWAVLDNGMRIQTIHTRPAADGEITEEDRDAVRAGRRVDRAMRQALQVTA